MKKYGYIISKLRKKHGLTQEQLGKKLNVSYQAVSKWENNLSEPDLETIEKLTEVFGISITDFFDMEKNFCTGKRTIKYNGVTLNKVKNNLFVYNDGEVPEQFEVKGNQLVGLTIKMFGKEVDIARKLAWYEIVMAVLVFVPCILFGAVGGAIGGALGFTNLTIIRQVEKLYLKIIISVQFMLIGLLLSYIFAVLVFKIVFPFM